MFIVMSGQHTVNLLRLSYQYIIHIMTAGQHFYYTAISSDFALHDNGSENENEAGDNYMLSEDQLQ